MERKGEILKTFLDKHCMWNFWISLMRLSNVVSLLQTILSDRVDKTKWQPISSRDILQFLHPFCYSPLLCKKYGNFQGFILWISVLLQSQLLWQFLLSILSSLLFLVHAQKWYWLSSSSNWATSGGTLQFFVCSLCIRRWQNMDLFGRTACAQCWHSGDFLAGIEEANLGHEAWQRVCWQQLVIWRNSSGLWQGDYRGYLEW